MADKNVDEPIFSGAAFAAMAAAATKIVLAGLFHESPELLDQEKTVAEWQKAIDKFLADPAE